jgi:hypothetical protein
MKNRVRSWRVKGIIQRVLSAIPYGTPINNSLQIKLGDLRNFDRNIDIKVADWSSILTYLVAVQRGKLEGQTILEIGTGWYPTLPLCFVLAGAVRVYTIDLTKHISWLLTRRMLKALDPHLDSIAAATHRPASDVRDVYHRLTLAKSLPELLSRANIVYRAPQDGSALTWLRDGTLDLVYSNSVLEHVVPSALCPLMRESWRTLSENGLMIHAVACNDHYAHFDNNISFVNYLRFPDKQWAFWNCRLNYQNRLRASDFTRIARKCGFEIIHERRHVRLGVDEALSRIELAPQFAAYNLDDLRSTSVNFVAAKVHSDPGEAKERGGTTTPVKE